jgi:hypothetical protein
MKFIFPNLSMLFLFASVLSDAQETIYKDTRLVVVNYPDSTVQTRILTSHVNIKPDNAKIYYWYLPDQINSNQGSYAGYPLHGAYYVYDRHDHLIGQGAFFKGLKTGIWKKWDTDGKLLEQTKWNKGHLYKVPDFRHPDKKAARGDTRREAKLKVKKKK